MFWPSSRVIWNSQWPDHWARTSGMKKILTNVVGGCLKGIPRRDTSRTIIEKGQCLFGCGAFSPQDGRSRASHSLPVHHGRHRKQAVRILASHRAEFVAEPWFQPVHLRENVFCAARLVALTWILTKNNLDQLVIIWTEKILRETRIFAQMRLVPKSVRCLRLRDLYHHLLVTISVIIANAQKPHAACSLSCQSISKTVHEKQKLWRDFAYVQGRLSLR